MARAVVGGRWRRGSMEVASIELSLSPPLLASEHEGATLPWRHNRPSAAASSAATTPANAVVTTMSMLQPRHRSLARLALLPSSSILLLPSTASLFFTTRVRGERDRSSFSTSFLDAIYHSLDEGGDIDTSTTCRSEDKALVPASPQFWWAGKPKHADRHRRRETGPTAAARPRHSGYASSTASSSDFTSSYSFSCSSASTTNTDSTRRRRSPPPPRRQLEELVPVEGAEAEADAAALPPSDKANKKGRSCFPVARLHGSPNLSTADRVIIPTGLIDQNLIFFRRGQCEERESCLARRKGPRQGACAMPPPRSLTSASTASIEVGASGDGDLAKLHEDGNGTGEGVVGEHRMAAGSGVEEAGESTASARSSLASRPEKA